MEKVVGVAVVGDEAAAGVGATPHGVGADARYLGIFYAMKYIACVALA